MDVFIYKTAHCDNASNKMFPIKYYLLLLLFVNLLCVICLYLFIYLFVYIFTCEEK